MVTAAVAAVMAAATSSATADQIMEEASDPATAVGNHQHATAATSADAATTAAVLELESLYSKDEQQLAMASHQQQPDHVQQQLPPAPRTRKKLSIGKGGVHASAPSSNK